eukprot:m.854047 g.854047  ORF g.854047 m.854047 type:complete len:365 (+) comp59616_c2_seq9:411-1505(+)
MQGMASSPGKASGSQAWPNIRAREDSRQPFRQLALVGSSRHFLCHCKAHVRLSCLQSSRESRLTRLLHFRQADRAVLRPTLGCRSQRSRMPCTTARCRASIKAHRCLQRNPERRWASLDSPFFSRQSAPSLASERPTVTATAVGGYDLVAQPAPGGYDMAGPLTQGAAKGNHIRGQIWRSMMRALEGVRTARSARAGLRQFEVAQFAERSKHLILCSWRQAALGLAPAACSPRIVGSHNLRCSGRSVCCSLPRKSDRFLHFLISFVVLLPFFGLGQVMAGRFNCARAADRAQLFVAIPTGARSNRAAELHGLCARAFIVLCACASRSRRVAAPEVLQWKSRIHRSRCSCWRARAGLASAHCFAT